MQSNPATRSFSVMFPAENIHLVTSNSYLKQKGEEEVMSFTQLLGNFINWCARLIITDTYPIPLSTCLTQLCSPNSIVTTGDRNLSLEIRLIFAKRVAPRPSATVLHSCPSTQVGGNYYISKLIILGNLHPPRASFGTPHWVGPQFFFSSIPK